MSRRTACAPETFHDDIMQVSFNIKSSTYVFERVCLVADGASLAVDALPEVGREDLPRELLRVVQARRVNCNVNPNVK